MAAIIPNDAEDFPDIGSGLVDAADRFIDWLVINAGDFFESIAAAVRVPLLAFERALDWAPPWLILVVFAVVAFVAARRIIFTVAVVAVVYLLGALQLWEEAMQTIAIMLTSILLAVLIGLPLGVSSGRSDRVKALLTPVLDIMQTIPPFVYLLPVVMLFGLGNVSGIIVVVVYATPPLVRLTDLGIREVSGEVTEAARAFGATRWQTLRGVQLPLALPSIMQGVNQTTMAALSMVVVASLIGTRGLGQVVYVGLNQFELGEALLGGTGIVLLAIVFDRVTQAAGRRAQVYRNLRG